MICEMGGHSQVKKQAYCMCICFSQHFFTICSSIIHFSTFRCISFAKKIAKVQKLKLGSKSRTVSLKVPHLIIFKKHAQLHMPILHSFILLNYREMGRIGIPTQNHQGLIHRIYCKMGRIRIVGQFAPSYSIFCESTPGGSRWVFRFAPLVPIRPISWY